MRCPTCVVAASATRTRLVTKPECSTGCGDVFDETLFAASNVAVRNGYTNPVKGDPPSGRSNGEPAAASRVLTKTPRLA